MPNKQIWVSPKNGGGWRVHKPGSCKDSFHLNTKAQAIQKAESIARNQMLETKIQNKDGRISGGNSYGNDPYPPEG